MEEVQHDLAADRRAELGEHALALARVLDERILLRHRAQVHALAQVVHVLEVLAPADVDDLEDHEPLELAHQRRLVGPNSSSFAVYSSRASAWNSSISASRVMSAISSRSSCAVISVLYSCAIAFVSASRSHSSGNSLLRELEDGRLDELVDPRAHLVRHVLALEHLPALLVDATAVPVHHVVVLEDVLAHDEVLLLDLLLRALDLAREELRLHRLVVRDLEALHDPVDPLAGEQAHEIVLAREVEARLAGVALAARAAAELVVDAPRLVALGAEHVEPADLEHAFAELDVDAAAGHVRRDRDRAELARVLDDLGLARVLLRVQHVVRDALARQQLREVLGRLDGDRADEHRLPGLVALLDVARDGGELAFLRLEDEILLVVARDVDVRRDLDDVEVVDLDELLLLRLRGTGHAGELVVEAEVVLQRDRGERLVLLLDAHALLRLDRLVQALAPAAALHDAAGELVDDLHLVVLDHVLDVAVVERLRLQRLDEMVDELRVLRRVEVVDAAARARPSSTPCSVTATVLCFSSYS